MLRYNFSGDLRLDMLKTFCRNEIFPSSIIVRCDRLSGI